METLIDIRNNIAILINSQKMALDMQNKMQKEKQEFWHFLKEDLFDSDSKLKAIFATNSFSEILDIYHTYWENFAKNMGIYHSIYRNIHCEHSLVILDEETGYGICPVCWRYIALEDIPQAHFIVLPNIVLNEKALIAVRNQILDLVTADESLTIEEVAKLITQKVSQNKTLKRINYEN